jgi:SAM-dependent methyltransferase
LTVLHDDRRRAGSFGDDAEQYDRARPTYPAPLIDDLLDDRTHDVLDVGCGTGKVGRLFAERGRNVLGVEPDERMAVVARRHGLIVELATFETWDARDRTFDLVVAGQTWHWVEPDAGARKAAAVLRPHGRAAAFWNRSVLPDGVKGEFEAVYQRLAPDKWESILIGNIGDSRFSATADSFRRTGSFGHPQIRTYTWSTSFTREQWLDLLPTHSDHRTLPPARLAALSDAIGDTITRLGGRFDVTFETVVVSARRER